MARKPRSVIKSGSPGPAPTSTISPVSWTRLSISCASLTAPLKSPCMALLAAGLSNTASQNPLRASTLVSFCFTSMRRFPARSAKRPSFNGRRVSIQPRTLRDRVGDCPILDTATRMGKRSIMAGNMIVHSSVRSTQFTKTPCFMAATKTASLT